jgi:thiol-disulfide isomerase/thioredoxin
VGSTAPDFVSWDLQGNELRLSSLKGHPIVLSFWATWCTACRDEFPQLQRIEDEQRPGGLLVLAVDYKESNSAAMQQFLSGLHVDFRSVIDPQGAIASAYQINIGLPVNVWIERNETVAAITVGQRPAADLESLATKIAV